MGADSHRYRFHTEWRLEAPAELVYSTLRDVPAYPEWWPEVRSARQLDDVTGELRCRSMLPYDLVFVIEREIEDEAAGRLRARMTGDLIGSSEWLIQTAGDGTTIAVFDEDVTVGKTAVRIAGQLARPALRFNHDRMMRSGQRGLRRHLGQGA